MVYVLAYKSSSFPYWTHLVTFIKENKLDVKSVTSGTTQRAYCVFCPVIVTF